ncbi:hypothetical protein ABZS86_08955 [Streptomyces sp. NPDC005355]|uniref:hypothetical protein n=1 Tax=Streptomyces sp. NPDC005355 TaxID=3157038 RepID=UPI0033BF5840
MKDRSKVRTGLAAVAALCAAAAAPGPIPVAAADSTAGARAYETQGTRIEGAGDDTDAPPLTTGRTYVDSVAPGEKRYYSAQLDGESAAYVSAVAAPRPGAGVASYRDGVKVTLENPDGGICDTASPKVETNDVAYPLADYASRQIGSGSVASCRKAGRYLVTVERQADSQDPDRWPLELRLMVEPPVKGGATGQTPEGSWHTTPPRPPSGSTHHQQGGRGFADAPLVATGAWEDQFRPGETHFYRVPVEWGQQISAVAELPADGTDKSTRLLDQAVGMRAYNPARGLAKRGTVSAQEGEPPRTEVSTAPAAYGNRFAKADYSIRAMSFTGGYYLAVTLNPSDVAPHVKGTVPVILRVRVAGDTRSGPTYDGNAVKAGFGLSDADRRAAKRQAMPVPGAGPQAAADESRDGLRAVGYAGLGTGTALLLGLGVWTLSARRRAPASVSGAPVEDPTTGQQRYGPPPAW